VSFVPESAAVMFIVWQDGGAIGDWPA
jgi:hypothetical protein